MYSTAMCSWKKPLDIRSVILCVLCQEGAEFRSVVAQLRVVTEHAIALVLTSIDSQPVVGDRTLSKPVEFALDPSHRIMGSSTYRFRSLFCKLLCARIG